MMQGILIVDKPMDWTSFDVVAKLRGVLGTRKLGHSGTLDPMATGVLPVFCGGASKAVDLQLNHDKTYRATLRLGARTDTGDSTGTVLENAPVTAGVTITVAAGTACLTCSVGNTFHSGHHRAGSYGTVRILGVARQEAHGHGGLRS